MGIDLITNKPVHTKDTLSAIENQNHVTNQLIKIAKIDDNNVENECHEIGSNEYTFLH